MKHRLQNTVPSPQDSTAHAGDSSQWERRRERRAEIRASKGPTYIDSLAITGETIPIIKSDEAFQSQALFPFSSKTCWGSKVDKYDCRALLSEKPETSSRSRIDGPPEDLQMNRFSALLLYLGEGASEADIISWASSVHRESFKGAFSQILSPTAFAIEKAKILDQSPSLLPASPDCSLPRMSNADLDRMASKSGIQTFSKRVFRSSDDSTSSRKYSDQSWRKGGRNRHMEDVSGADDWEEAISARDTKSKSSNFVIEIETSDTPDTLIIPHHLSQTDSQILQSHRSLEDQSTWTRAKNLSNPASLSDPLSGRQESINNSTCSGIVPAYERREGTSSTANQQSHSPPHRRRSPTRSSDYSRRSYEDIDRRQDKAHDGYSSPPRKKPKMASSSSSGSSKLDRMLAQLEEKHKSKR
jgi:hypothetical protein